MNSEGEECTGDEEESFNLKEREIEPSVNEQRMESDGDEGNDVDEVEKADDEVMESIEDNE